MSGGLKDRDIGMLPLSPSQQVEPPAAAHPLSAPAPRQAGLSKAEAPHAGHRQRLKDRFVAGGEDAVPDYELLELILFSAIPRRDTKPIAKQLIERFGTFAEVISAPRERLTEVPGVSDAAVLQFKLVRAGALRLMRQDIMRRPVLGSWDAVLDYCRAAMGFEAREQFRILFLDKRNRLIADEMQQEGTVDHTPVYVREVVKRALELSSTALILVHNHPSGDPTPSRADLDMTRRIIDVAKPLGIAIHDHIIVGRDGHASFRAMKLL